MAVDSSSDGEGEEINPSFGAHSEDDCGEVDQDQDININSFRRRQFEGSGEYEDIVLMLERQIRRNITDAALKDLRENVLPLLTENRLFELAEGGKPFPSS